MDACQRTRIAAALSQHQGNRAHAARALQVDASNLHKLARRLGIKRENDCYIFNSNMSFIRER